MYDSAYILVVVLHVKLPAKKLVYIYIYDLSIYIQPAAYL